MAKKIGIIKLSDGTFRKYNFYRVSKFVPFVKSLNPRALYFNIYDKSSRRQIAWCSCRDYIVHYI